MIPQLNYIDDVKASTRKKQLFISKFYNIIKIIIFKQKKTFNQK